MQTMLRSAPRRVGRIARMCRGAVLLPLCALFACELDLSRSGEPVVASVRVTPSSATIEVGEVQRFEAAAFDDAGHSITDRSFFWSISDPAIARLVDGGGVEGLAPGAVQVSVSAGGRSALAHLSVVPVAVAGVAVTPETSTVRVHERVQLTAKVTDRAGNELTDRPVIWTTVDPTIAVVDGAGMVVGLTPGRTVVRAQSEGKVGEAELTVLPGAAGRIEIEADGALLTALDDTLRLRAVVRDDFGNEITDAAVSWASLDPSVVTVDASGLVRARGNGSGRITARYLELEATLRIEVEQRPESLAVTPGVATMNALSATLKLTAHVRDRNGFDVAGASVTWQSLTPGVVSVDATGLVSSLAVGMARVRAAHGAFADTATVTVRQVVASVIVEPALPQLLVGDSLQLGATGLDSSSVQIPGLEFAWTSVEPDVATVTAAGRVHAHSEGVAEIFATAEGVSGSAVVVVVDRVVSRVAVSPESAMLTALGDSVRFTAQAFDQRGDLLVGEAISWTSLDTDVATVSPDGWARAEGNGVAGIVASAGGRADTAFVRVDQVPVSIEVTGDGQRGTAGEPLDDPLGLRVVDANGHGVPGLKVEWEVVTGGGSIAEDETTTGPTGHTSNTLTLDIIVGPNEVLASVPGVGSHTFTAVGEPGAIDKVSIDPGSVGFSAIGQTAHASATAYDRHGNPVPGAVVTWSTSDATVATVTAAGEIRAEGNGDAWVIARSNGAADSAQVTVQQVVASVTVTPELADVTVGGSLTLTAEAWDANGHRVPFQGPDMLHYDWSSSDDQIVAVPPEVSDAEVTVDALQVGIATVSATVEGVSGSATITVVPDDDDDPPDGQESVARSDPAGETPDTPLFEIAADAHPSRAVRLDRYAFTVKKDR